jgi:hypothetical protein
MASAQAPRTVAEKLGYPANARLLIIHADDLGLAHSANRATFEALEKGWITSASIMVPCPWFPEAARFAREHPQMDLGLHLTLNSEWTGYRWRPLTAYTTSLVDIDGYFPLVETTVAEKAKPAEVEKELRAQIELARKAGVQFTHLDSHMGALFETAELFGMYERLAHEYNVPNLVSPGTEGRFPPGYTPAGGLIIDQVVQMSPGVPREQWLDAYKKMLTPLKPGVYQLIVHLGYDDDEMRGMTWDHPDWGAAWRQADLETVGSPEFRDFLKQQGFVLVTWKQLAQVRGK